MEMIDREYIVQWTARTQERAFRGQFFIVAMGEDKAQILARRMAKKQAEIEETYIDIESIELA